MGFDVLRGDGGWRPDPLLGRDGATGGGLPDEALTRFEFGDGSDLQLDVAELPDDIQTQVAPTDLAVLHPVTEAVMRSRVLGPHHT